MKFNLFTFKASLLAVSHINGILERSYVFISIQRILSSANRWRPNFSFCDKS